MSASIIDMIAEKRIFGFGEGVFIIPLYTRMRIYTRMFEAYTLQHEMLWAWSEQRG
jgi:hypothetical protein